MTALSFRRLVLLALVFVTTVSAAGPTPTSVQKQERNLHARDGGKPYRVRHVVRHEGGDRYGSGGRNDDDHDRDDRDRNGGSSGWDYNHNNYYNGGGNGGWGPNNGGSGGGGGGGHEGWNKDGWGNGGGGGGWGGGDHGGGGGGWPQPSQRLRQRTALKSSVPMSPDELAKTICPSELTACPIADPGSLSAIPTSVTGWAEQGFECVDLGADLRACGGCPSLDSKYDCTSIEGADGIACVSGQCVVDSCHAGYELDSNKSTCNRK